MMVNPVSSVRFCADVKNEAGDNNIFSRPGTYTKPAVDTVEVTPKKSSSTGKTVLKVLGGLAVVAAALAVGNKTGLLKVAENGVPEGFFAKIGHYLGQAGETIAKYTYELPKEQITKFFSKNA